MKEVIKPILDHVLVSRDEAEQQSDGGIVIPMMARQLSLRATVVAVGPGRALEGGAWRKMTVKPGDKVFIAKHNGGIAIGELYLLREDDVLAIIKQVDE